MGREWHFPHNQSLSTKTITIKRNILNLGFICTEGPIPHYKDQFCLQLYFSPIAPKYPLVQNQNLSFGTLLKR